MKWQCKEFVSFVSLSSQKICDYLNKLNDYGIKTTDIKVSFVSPSWCVIYYYYDQEID